MADQLRGDVGEIRDDILKVYEVLLKRKSGKESAEVLGLLSEVEAYLASVGKI